MPSASRLRMVIEVDLSADPIAGRLEPPAGPILSFAGWIGLARALESALRREPGPIVEPAHEGPDEP